MIRWAPFWPMPGHRGQRLDVLAGHGAAQLVGASAPRASPAPASGRRRWRSAAARRRDFSSSSRKPNRVSDSSRTTMLVGRRRRRADVQGGQRGRGAAAARARRRRPRGRRESSVTSATVPRDERDHRARPSWPVRRAADGRPRRCGPAAPPAPDVADRQRERVGGVGGRRARASSRSSRVTIAATWALSARPLPLTAALTSLGVCSATGRPRRAADHHRDPAGLGGAHHGADVVLAEHPLDGDGVGPVQRRARPRAPRSIGTAAAARRAARRRCGRRRRRPSAAAGPTTPSTTPRPQRVSPGSIPSTRIRAALASEHLFGPDASRGRPVHGATPSRAGRRRRRTAGQASSGLPSTSSVTSKLPKTFCTSSRSSSASTSRKHLGGRRPRRARLSSTGTNDASAES